MKKRFLAVLALAVVLAVFAGCAYVPQSSPNVNSFTAPSANSFTATNYLDEFLQAHPDRTSFGEGEVAAAGYIEGKFRDFGLESVTVSAVKLNNESKVYQTQNVTGVYRASSFTSSSVIVGFNYDNNYKGNDFVASTNAEGAYATGGSVAAALMVAEYLTATKPSLPFNVVFVAFGAGESVKVQMGEAVSYGAYAYVVGDGEGYQGMSITERLNTRLMINLNGIGGGDYTYLYTGEDENRGAEIRSALSLSSMFRQVPTSRPSTNLAPPYISGLSYAHACTIGANAPFMAAGINIINLYGGNMEFGLFNFNSESAEHPAIKGTRDDTRAVLASYYPQFRQRVVDAAEFVADTLTNDPNQLLALFEGSAPTNRYLDSVLYTSLTTLGVMIVLFVIAILWSRHLTKRQISEEPPVAPPPPRKPVFGEEYEKASPPPKNPFEGY